jgi:hypothetical protein
MATGRVTETSRMTTGGVNGYRPNDDWSGRRGSRVAGGRVGGDGPNDGRWGPAERRPERSMGACCRDLWGENCWWWVIQLMGLLGAVR